MSEVPAQRRELKRSLSLWQVTASGVGIVIGAGIYALIGPATEHAGTAVWLSFLLAAVLSGLTGLSYAELAGMFPSAGAEYAFARQAFNKTAGFLAGWLMISANVIAAAAVSIGFAHYLRTFVSVDTRLAALCLLAVITAVIAAGVQRSIWLSLALVVLQVGGLLLVIVAGAPHIGSRDLLAGGSLSGVLGGAALIFFAFIGFDEVVTLSEETRDPAHVIPRALLLSLGISAGLYMLVAIAAVSVVGADALAGSATSLTLVIEHDWGTRAGDIVALIALAATMNTTLLMLTAASRLLFRMSRDAMLPIGLSAVSSGSAAPYAAGLLVGTLAMGFALLGDISLIAEVTDFSVYVIFLVVNASLVALRLRMPEGQRTFVVPFAIRGVPIIPLLASFVVLVLVTQLQAEAWAVGAVVIGLGLLLWIARSSVAA